MEKIQVLLMHKGCAPSSKYVLVHAVPFEEIHIYAYSLVHVAPSENFCRHRCLRHVVFHPPTIMLPVSHVN